MASSVVARRSVARKAAAPAHHPTKSYSMASSHAMPRTFGLLVLMLCMRLNTIDASCRQLFQAATPQNKSADVLIIGAGAAGVTAARHLADTTAASVIILEARNRTGGRLHSIDTPYGKQNLFC